MEPRILAAGLALAGSLAGTAPVGAESPPITPPVWFEIGAEDRAFGESYLLPVSDPALIAQARARLAQGEASGVGAIAVARIRAGGDGLNRNLRDPDAPRWSWHVTELVEFADVAMEICDGWPGFVQEDPAAFVANTGATVCFWGYRLVRELDEAPAMRIDDALDGFWYAPAAAGQGFAFDALPAQQMGALGWFTYSERGDGTQRWLSGAGAIAGDRVEIALGEPQGGRFAAPGGTIVARPVGTLSLRFLDCNRAQAIYLLDDGSDGTLALERMIPSWRCGAD